MQKREITALCTFVRSTLEDLRFTHEIVGFESFQNFPRACCKITSLVMMYYLSSIKGVPKKDLVLLANAEIGECSHAWFKYRNLHIDLTGDQFDKSKITVSEQDPWPNSNYSKHPFEKEGFGLEYEQRLIKVCEYLES